MRAKALIFDSHYDADFIESEIKNGVMITKDKDFFLDKTRPFILRKKKLLGRIFGDSVVPVYLMKWNTLIPAHFELHDSKAPLKEQLKHIKDAKLKKELEEAIKVDEELGNKEYIYRELVPVELKFPEVYKKKETGADGKVTERIITPELLNSISDMRFLKGFKNYAGGGAGGKKNMMNILFIVGIGAFVVLAMVLGGVLQFSK